MPKYPFWPTTLHRIHSSRGTLYWMDAGRLPSGDLLSINIWIHIKGALT